MTDTLDARLVAPAAAVWAGAFVATASPPGWSAGWLVLGSVALVAAVVAARSWLRGGATAAVALLVLLCLVAGCTVGALRLAAVRGSGLAEVALERATVRATGVVRADPVRNPGTVRGAERGADLVVALVRLDRVEVRGRAVRTRAPTLVLARDGRWLGLLPGQRVGLSGRLGPARAGQPVAAIVSVRGPPTLIGRPPLVQRAAGDLRAGLRRAARVLPPAERGLLPGLVLGDTSRMPAALVDDFRTAGLTHLTAVSGANLAIVVTFVLVVGRWGGLRGRCLPATAALAMAWFVVLARPQPSVLRAAVMGAIALLALGTGRSRRSLAALAAAVLGLLLVDPWLARSFGFALSVLATGGLVLLAPGWARAWTARGLPRPLAEALAVPVAAQLVCAPVIVLLSGQVSLVAVVANLLAAPAVAPATVLGVLATAVAPLSDSAASVLATAAGVPVGWLVLVATRSAAVPGAAVDWPGSVRGAALLALVLVLAVVAARVLSRRPLAAAGATVALARGPGRPRDHSGMAAGRLAARRLRRRPGRRPVLAVPPGTAVVVDAGPDPPAIDRCLRRLGVRRVPMVLLTHLHADHVEGLPGVLRGRRVGEVATSGYDEPAGELARVRRWTERADVPLRTVSTGGRMSVGPVRWQILWPVRVIDEESVPNNASLVLLVRSRGLRLLLTGDVEPPAQRALLSQAGVPEVDVLKVAHHGSAHQESRLLAAARPRVALISAGAGNDYGHPAPSTLWALRRTGAIIGRTDTDGTLVVVGPPDRLRLVRAGG